MPELLDLQIFAAVAREGGFTAAARKLGLSKQAVSERVARLERELGVRLLERTTRHVHPTDAGVTFAARCGAIATQVVEAEREAQAASIAATGTLRISAPVVFGRHVLVPVLSELLERNPALRVEAVLTDRFVHLLDEGIDAAIRVGSLEDSTLRAKRLGSVRARVVASPDHLARFGRPRAAEALADARTITSRSDESWTLGRRRVRLAPVLVIGDLEAVRDAALRGLGIARLPDPICADGLAAGTLVELFPRQAPPPAAVHVVMPPGPYQPAKVRVVVEALAGAMASRR